MIVTDRFVAVHEPKTGGTFVTSALFQLYGAPWTLRSRLTRLLGRDLVSHGKHGLFLITGKEHWGCNQIPAAFSDRPILSSVRSPYDLYVSQYEFGWWKRREYLPFYRRVPEFRRRFAPFPDLSFAEYMELTDEAFHTLRNERFGDPRGPGLYTEQFVQFYLREPAETYARLDDAYIASQGYRHDLYDLRFLHTSRLNEDLYECLVGLGFAARDVEFIRGLGRILPGGKGRTADQRWESYYSPELKRSVRERDRLVFAIFPEFDV